MKLSKTQLRALNKLTDNWQNGYQLQEGLNTLKSLTKLELASQQNKVGCYFIPRINNTFKLTEKGKQLLEDLK